MIKGLKLGHKNLIFNLCKELQKTNLEEFQTDAIIQTIPSPAPRTTEVIIFRRMKIK